MTARDPAAVTFRLPSNRGHYYGGAWKASLSGAVTAMTSPATGESLGAVANGGAADAEHAVAAAARAFPQWRDMPAQKRAQCIRAASAILRDNADELAWLDALDAGNPLQAMRYDVEISAAYMDHFAGLVTEMKGATIPIEPGILNYTLREPLGVVARIGAFNHPLLFTAGKCGAPLAAGNTLIVKPADQTPLTTLRFAELWESVFPAGVFNVVTGGRDTGAALVAHPKVAKIGFIGSVNAGRAVMSGASATLKALTLELGGKNALIACADATPAEVADGVVRGMNFRYVTGQSCNSTSRVYLHSDIHDATLAEIVKRVAQLKVGLPTERDNEVGCLSSQAQY
ncbi:MAG: aldehyde dehydrogenase family protein, partial [Burkholderiales bacterium]